MHIVIGINSDRSVIAYISSGFNRMSDPRTTLIGSIFEVLVGIIKVGDMFGSVRIDGD